MKNEVTSEEQGSNSDDDEEVQLLERKIGTERVIEMGLGRLVQRLLYRPCQLP